MTQVENLRQKLQKAEENVAKREATIERHKAQLSKKIAKLQKVGWIDTENLESYRYDENARKKYEQETGSQLYWDICEVESKKQDIKDSYEKLEELQKIVSNWKYKLSKAELNESILTREIPESFKSYKDYLVKQWNEWDIKRRNRLLEEYKRDGWSKFINNHTSEDYRFKDLSDGEINKENERDADSLILDLYQRIFKYTGKVVSWNYLTISQGHINGNVEGELSNVRVESILAGGYNIQRLHVRVLVHPYEKSVKVENNKEYKDMTLEELEQLADKLGAVYKKCDNSSINRMRLVMSIKKITK